jgi:hypothetical protein
MAYQLKIASLAWVSHVQIGERQAYVGEQSELM